MDSPLSGQVALVTGAASGIGAALSEELAALGAHVILTDRQDELAASVVQRIVAGGGSAEYRPLDVTDLPAWQGLAAHIEAQYGCLDYLFNNAGIGVGGEVKNMSAEDWQQIVAVNVHGVINGVQACYPAMVRQRRGHIINTASAAGLGPTPLSVAYCATKHAVVGLSTSLRAEAAIEGVKVSVLCPGVIRTPILEGGKYGRIIGFDAKQLVAMWEITRPMDVRRFARKALKAVQRNRAIIVIPFAWRVSWWLGRLSPGWQIMMARLAYRYTLKRLERQGR